MSFVIDVHMSRRIPSVCVCVCVSVGSVLAEKVYCYVFVCYN